MARRAGCGCLGCGFRFFGLITTALIVLFVWALVEPHNLTVDAHTVRVSGLPAAFDGTTIAYCSDIHVGRYAGKPEMDKLIAAIAEYAPDVICLGGDYVENRESDRGPLYEGLAQLRAPMGVYAVLGNHDTGQSAASWRDKLAECGVTLLYNQSVRLTRGGASLTLAGVGDHTTNQADLSAALEDVPRGERCILLSHNPFLLKQIEGKPPAARIALMLCGHTHGGQFSLFGLWSPSLSREFGQRYISGWYKVDGFDELTSNGVGVTSIPLRFMRPPQVHIITLKAGA